ncbi:phage portal protein [Microbacterium schleiferi]|uniref:phage portal protein n=1 Tax=Microbacterium schleiferi TaxID=69362 RepID=UPI00226C6AC9|nr:phage portal protein [Microbacterium schleiferi]
MWACVRLRADLVSTLPIDTFRKVPWGQVEVPKPPVLVEPGGSQVDIVEWMYSTQSDLDSLGNTVGLITEKDGVGKPRRIDLVAREDYRITSVRGAVEYWIQGKKRDSEDVWHERQFTSSGMVVGMSPVAYAALSLQQYESAQEFAAAWFGGGLVPTAHLKYGEAKVPPAESEAIKARFMVAIENGEPFVTGKDWEYKPIDAAAAQATFIETMRFTDIEIGRFFGVPGDLFDAAVEGSSITYANITQRNLQFLVHNLGPAITRRERALSKLLPQPRFVKFNSDALLRMDPETVSTMLGQQVKDRLVAPSEARELLNRAPYTPEQIDEFKTLFPTEFKEIPAGAQRGDAR